MKLGNSCVSEPQYFFKKFIHVSSNGWRRNRSCTCNYKPKAKCTEDVSPSKHCLEKGRPGMGRGWAGTSRHWPLHYPSPQARKEGMCRHSLTPFLQCCLPFSSLKMPAKVSSPHIASQYLPQALYTSATSSLTIWPNSGNVWNNIKIVNASMWSKR